MQEELKKVIFDKPKPEKRSVALSLRSRLFALSGTWDWDMYSTAVYCSDVMLFPAGFEGTKGIIHPDDLDRVSEAIEEMQEAEISRLHFRLITTYGEIKNISGHVVSIEEDTVAEKEAAVAHEALQEAVQEMALQKELLFLRLRNTLADASEKLEASGTWYTNKVTGEYWYSDGVFRLHGIPPQSLNGHANTFSPFIHPDDSVAVLEAFEQAYTAGAPLHLEYRIVQPGGQVHFVRHLTGWSFDERGQYILSGVIYDHTELQQQKNDLNRAEDDAKLLQQAGQFVEKQVLSGSWIMNMVTRKVTFSDNYLRIHGVKSPFLPSHKTFINLVHPEEKGTVLAALERMYVENVLPEIEYRIIRPDGKQRYLRLSGKPFIHKKIELMMVGVVNDITAQINLQKEITELNAARTLQDSITEITEQAARVSSVVWFANGQMQWSDGFYKLIGYKPNAVVPVHRLWQRTVHSEDVKLFNDAIALALNQQAVDDLRFRMVSKSGMRHFRLHFQNMDREVPGTLIGIVQDTTAQVALEQITADKEQYAALLEGACKDVILLTNTENIIINWNAAAAEKTGVASDDARHKNLFDVLPYLNEETYLSQLHGAMMGREVNVPKAKNSYLARAHSFQLLPFKDEHGAVTGVLHIVRDIARELEMQQQLSERLLFIENLLNATVDRIVVLDQQMNYLYWNPKAEEYYGISKHRVLGKNILEVFPAFRNDPSYQEFRRALKGETVHLPATAQENSNGYSETYLIPIKNEEGKVNAVLWIVHDLSKELMLQQERQKHLKLLQEEHRRMLDAQAIGRIGSFEWNLGDETVNWSDELYRINGMEPQLEKATLEKTAALVHPDDRDTLEQLKVQALQKPGLYQLMHRIIGADDVVKYVRHQFESVADENGTVVRVHGTVQDVTEREKAALELKATKESLQAILDSSLYVIQAFKAVRDEHGKIIDFIWVMNNKKAIEQNGEAIGKSLLLHSPGLVPTGLFEMYIQVTETGIAVDHEVFYNHEQFNSWFHQTLVKADDGFVMSTEDITEKRKFREEIMRLKDAAAQNATDKYLTLFNNMEQGFCIVEMIFDKKNQAVDYRFFETNPVFEKQTGLQDAVGKTMRQLQPAHEEHWFQIYGKVVETGQPVHFESKAAHLSGGVWYDVYAFPYGNPQNHQVAILFNNITERKKSEEALRESEEKYRTLFSTMEQGFCIIEKIDTPISAPSDYRYLIANPAFERHTLLTDVVGKTIWQILPEAERSIIDIYDEVIATGEYRHLESHVSALDMWMEADIFPAQKRGQLAVLFTNVTERKKAAIALSESEDRFRSLVTATSNSVYIMSADWKLMYNLQGKDFLADTSNSENSWIEKYIPEAERERVQEAINVAIENKKIFELEHQVIADGGGIAWVYSRAIPKLNDGGELVEWMGAGENITERKKATEALQQSEEQLKMLNADLEAQVAARTAALHQNAAELQKNIAILQQAEQIAQIGSWEYEIESSRFSWSDGMYGLFNKKMGEAVAPELYVEYATDDCRAAARKIVDLLQKDHQPFEETLHITVAGQEKIIRIKATVLHDKKGMPQKVIGVDLDLTDIREAEARLEESQEMLQQSVLATPDAIVILNLEQKSTSYLNNVLSEWSGYSNKELIDRGFEGRLQLVHPDDRQRFADFNEALLSAKDDEVKELDYRLQGINNLYWIRNRSRVFRRNKEGRPTHLLSILQNITTAYTDQNELTRLNASLQQKNKELQAKNEEITSFAFVASHDLKEPIRKIHTFTDMLLHKESTELSESSRDLLMRMNASVKHLALLIRDIQELSRIHSETTGFENVNLNEAVQKATKELAGEIAATGAVIKAAGLQPIYAIDTQIAYLFKNLISNAIKFQQPGNKPQVTIAAETISGAAIPGQEAPGQYLKVTVQDNGIGFDKEYKNKVFRIFQRLHAREAFSGTGMGLAICRKIMENHHGFIDVDSEAGRGTAFFCYFPI